MTGKVLVTGATGFVGRQVLRALNEHGCPVRLVIRDGSHSPHANVGIDAEIVVTQDLFAESSGWYRTVCQDIDTVIHVAWNVEPGAYLESPRNLDSLIGTLALARGAAASGVRKFVGVGTCFEYDVRCGKLSIETPLFPMTPYASAKAAAFIALSKWLPSQHVEFAWCRLFYLYGEGEVENRFVPYLRSRLAAGQFAELTAGTQVRDYLDVRIAGEAIVDAALGNENGPINVCSATPITIREFAEKIADEYGRHDLLRFGVRPDNLTDPPVILGIRKNAV